VIVLVPGGTSTFREFSKHQNDYFLSPNRRRSSLEEIPPSFFVRDRERSMIARNLRFVLRDTVSPHPRFGSAPLPQKVFPFFTTITGSFLAFWAYFDNGSEAYFSTDSNSISFFNIHRRDVIVTGELP
jgi:hypothetical protein